MYGIVSAYDRYFIKGIKAHGFKDTSPGEKSLESLAEFYKVHQNQFIECISLFKQNDNVVYTPMKLIDMYFWQVGYMLENEDEFIDSEIKDIKEFEIKYKENLYLQNPNKAKLGTKNNLKECIVKYIYDKLEEASQNKMEFIDLKCGDIQK
ncbi:hypothetical protein [Romboutsia sp. 1001216sp1]|uniref:hypothetical protein n=1 Tax=Romboutsia sp. 1001216sp1 TaxID=2986997 RepID=UPI0023310CAD|nr:hypothetical protein [Romboutsia sp. 1001216sp1]MDB8804797.1 hypothetical protein [Romboutsia sp. 1001216sp1]MDB8808112.1 hypothetical protein [Romboutsia sp. 1001216sp1]MDB8810443.1 hypothetical protein [Romboutsia sp. 1001216sp1]MDB8816162.1 hypothetical protein [Romboutsia sp. 1001216sp1]MDB8818884.1 hypothetical protein [Romboutsia sp. 1001216sp1]